jgi:ribonuclease HI
VKRGIQIVAKQKWYVVWKGINPGIYTSWSECEIQVKGYSDAKFKSFDSEKEAEIAFQTGPNYNPSASIQGSAPSIYENMNGVTTGRTSCTTQNLSNVPKSEGQSDIPKSSISVDAACSGNPGVLEYRGVDTDTGETIFHEGPFPIGTNNIGEFLALVTALQMMKQLNCDGSVFTDSVTAMSWVKNKRVNTNLPRNGSTNNLWVLVDEKLSWLSKNIYRTKIIKWDTKKLGEIKADFGRK